MNPVDASALEDLELYVRSSLYAVQDARGAALDLGRDFAREEDALRQIEEALDALLERIER